MKRHICIAFLAVCLLVPGCIGAPPQNVHNFDNSGMAHDNFKNNRDFGSPDYPSLGDGRHPSKRDNSFIGNHGASDSFQNNGGTGKVTGQPKCSCGASQLLGLVKGRFNGRIVGNNALNDQDNYNGYGAVYNSHSFDDNVAGDGSFNNNGNGLEPPVIYDPVDAPGNQESFDGNRVGQHSFNDNGNGLEPPVIYDPVDAPGNQESFDGNWVGHHSFNDNGDS
ncbi:insoluble matrix shell protein 4-like isoform X2 [Struthio camelus]|uniref:insoluble matrix shell protein 4-like isoform X2 n=1 Tax=Struthio camelus TaxID=8801 RepID=UPI003603CFB0